MKEEIRTDNTDVIANACKKIEELEKENAELKSEKGCETCTKFDEVKLTKAKEIIRQFLNDYPVITKELLDKLEQFIKEI